MCKNFLTFDIEEWFHANYEGIDPGAFSDDSDNLENNVDRLLEICAAYGVRATCFILGDVARQKPRIVRKIFDAGHEVASHGCSHALIHTMSPEAFRAELRTSADLLSQITGERVVGFRAPSWSVKRPTLEWFYTILHEEGYEYSSSVYPAKHTLFGIEGFASLPHYPAPVPVLEIPQSVMNLLGNRVGYAGGGYLRFFPGRLIRRVIRNRNRAGESVFLYLHPREIDPDQPRLKLGLVDGYFHYQGIAKTEAKLRYLLDDLAPGCVRMDAYARMMRESEPGAF